MRKSKKKMEFDPMLATLLVGAIDDLALAKSSELQERKRLWRDLRKSIPKLLEILPALVATVTTAKTAESAPITLPDPFDPMPDAVFGGGDGPPLGDDSLGGCTERWAETYVSGGTPLDYTCPHHNVAPMTPCPGQAILSDIMGLKPIPMGTRPQVPQQQTYQDPFEMIGPPPPLPGMEEKEPTEAEIEMREQAISDAVSAHLGKVTGLQWQGPIIISAIVEGAKEQGLTEKQWNLLRAAGVPVHPQAGPVLGEEGAGEIKPNVTTQAAATV